MHKVNISDFMYVEARIDIVIKMMVSAANSDLNEMQLSRLQELRDELAGRLLESFVDPNNTWKDELIKQYATAWVDMRYPYGVDLWNELTPRWFAYAVLSTCIIPAPKTGNTKKTGALVLAFAEDIKDNFVDKVLRSFDK